jgi:hypothetical protein
LRILRDRLRILRIWCARKPALLAMPFRRIAWALAQIDLLGLFRRLVVTRLGVGRLRLGPRLGRLRFRRRVVGAIERLLDLSGAWLLIGFGADAGACSMTTSFAGIDGAAEGSLPAGATVVSVIAMSPIESGTARSRP